jgi:PST family polysaccharide transporter
VLQTPAPAGHSKNRQPHYLPKRARSKGTRSLGDAAARGTGMTLATQGLGAVLQFGSVVVLARLLTPADFGLIAMVTSVIGVADLIRDFGLSSAAIQSKTLSDDERTNLFWVNTALGAGCALLAIALQHPIASAYSESKLAPVVVALAVVFLISGANTQFRADLTRSLRFTALSMSDLAAQAAGVAVAIALAVGGAGLWAIVWQQIAAAIVGFLINIVSCRWIPGLPRRGVSLQRFFRFGGGLLGTQVIHYINKNIDNIAIGLRWGAVPLGLYSRAYQLLMTPLNTINAPMTSVALPVLSRVQEDDETFVRYLGKVQLVGCYITATIFAVAAGLSHPLVMVLFGKRWEEVAPIFAVLAIGGIFRAVQQIGYWIYLARGLTGAQLRQFLFTGPMTIACILIGLPWGPIGVAVGHSVAYFLQWIISLAHSSKRAHISSKPLFINGIRAMLLVSAPCGGLAFLGSRMPVPYIAQLFVGVGFGVCYLLLACLVFPTVRTDTKTVLQFSKRAIGR